MPYIKMAAAEQRALLAELAVVSPADGLRAFLQQRDEAATTAGQQ